MGIYNMWYCDRCGKLRDGDPTDKETEICHICGNILSVVPTEYLMPGRQFPTITSEMRQKLINDLVLTSPNFDQYYFDNRYKIKYQQAAEFNAVVAHGKAVLEGRDKGNKFGISCPYCHATNVSKISSFSKAGHIALFGIFGVGKAGKQWHCSHCGSDF